MANSQLDEYVLQASDNQQEKGDLTSESNERILQDLDNMLPNKVVSVTVINKSYLPVAKYKHKVFSVAVDGEFDHPWGLAVEYSSNNMYVADHVNHKVQVFNEDGCFLFQFGHQDGICKMLYPVCIAISQERVIVSQQGLGCLLVYDLEGNFINQIGNQGAGKGDFNDPRGIAIHPESKNIFVCDHLNNRIQILSDYVITILVHALLSSPVSISLTKRSIFVLTRDAPFLFEFDYTYINSTSDLLSTVSKFVELSYSVCIDGAGRFLIADNERSCIVILDEEGNLLHSLREGISKPMAVTVDVKGRIIVADFNHTLLIF